MENPLEAGDWLYSQILFERDRLDALVVDWAVVVTGRRALDLVDDVHAVGHATEDRVLAVEPRRLGRRDEEELRAVGVRTGVGHRQRPARHLVLVELVLELIAGATRAGAL